MDDLDRKVIGLLRASGRMSISDLASHLDITRGTARARVARLEQNGQILGYKAIVADDLAPHPVRGLMLLGIEGRGAARITRALTGMPEVQAVHATNGRWDLVAEIGVESLPRLDEVLNRIRNLDGVQNSETNLLLATRI